MPVSIPRISDNRLLQVFIDEVLLKKEELGLSDNSKLTVFFGDKTNIEVNYNDSFDEDNTLNSDILRIIKNGEESSINITKIVFVDSTKSHSTLTYHRSADSLVDNLTTLNQILNDDVLLLHHKIESKLLSGISRLSSNDSLSDVFSAHHQVLTKLEGLNASLIDKQQEYTRKIDEEKRHYIDEQDKLFVAKNGELEEKYQLKASELENKYQSRSTDLDEREQKIQDADNTTARRETTLSVLKEAQEKAKQFDFSSSVKNYTRLTLMCAVLLGTVSAMVVILTLFELQTQNSLHQTQLNKIIEGLSNSKASNQTPTNIKLSDIQDNTYIWFLYLRTFLCSALFVSSILYLIKWFNSWANRIAQQELENQQFVRDLNRAHVAIEMCLEWNEKKDGGVPDHLLESLTEGLFKDKSKDQKEIIHPAEQIASALIKSADKVKIPLGMGEIETSGKNLRKEKSIKPKN